MGHCYSTPTTIRGNPTKTVIDAFSLFLESNCVIGSNQCVHIQKLEAAFAFYLDENNIVVRGWFQTTLDVVHSQMASLLKLLVPTSKMSPGYVDRPDNGDVATIDTRYAVGIDVVRFQK